MNTGTKQMELRFRTGVKDPMYDLGQFGWMQTCRLGSQKFVLTQRDALRVPLRFNCEE